MSLFFPCCSSQTNAPTDSTNKFSSYKTHVIISLASAIFAGAVAATALYFITHGNMTWTITAGSIGALATAMLAYTALRCLFGSAPTAPSNPPNPPQNDPIPQKRVSQWGEIIEEIELPSTGEKKKIAIAQRDENNSIFYTAVSDDDRELGYIQIVNIIHDDTSGKLQCPFFTDNENIPPFLPDEDFPEIEEPVEISNKLGRVWLNAIKVNPEDIEIGKLLMERVVKKSFEWGHEGRVQSADCFMEKCYTNPKVTKTNLNGPSSTTENNQPILKPAPQKRVSQWGEIITEIELPSTTGEKKKIAIAEKTDNKSILYAAVSEDDKNLGYIQIANVVYDAENDKLTSPYFPYGFSTNKIYDRSIKSSNKLGRVWINHIEVYQEGSGIGRKLMQVAIERSFEWGHEGRIQLDAAWNAAGFYYKLGLRAKDDRDNDAIEKELKDAARENRPPNTAEALGKSFIMFLPKQGTDTWKDEIKVSPILNSLEKN